MIASEYARTKLLETVGALLSEDDVRLEDNFVELGGNSILAMKVARVLETEANVRIDVSELLGDRIANITITEIAAKGGRV